MSESHWSDELGPGAAHPDAAGWVLGALSPADAEEFARHLQTCLPCQDAVRDLQPVRALMEGAAPPVDLPPGLQARTLRAVEAAAAEDALRRRRRGWLRALAAVAAAMLVLVAGGVTWTLSGRQSGPTVTIAMSAPGGGPATGRAVGQDTPHGWSVQLSVSGLPPIPEGQGHYECWYVAPSDTPAHPHAVSAGSFEVQSDGSASDVRMWTVVDLQQQKGTRMIVTREPDDDPARTGPVVLTGPVQAAA
jgi:hypothetical protein